MAIQMNFPSFGSLGCEIKGVSRDSRFFNDHHNLIAFLFSTKTSLNKDDPSPQISRHRNFPETKDADTTATTIETILNDNDTDNGCDWQY